jgi:hypothetical protein
MGSPQLLANLPRMSVNCPSDLIETLLEPVKPRRQRLYRVGNEVESSDLWQPRAVTVLP